MAQRISLTAGLLKTLEKEMSWDQLQDILAVPAAWKGSTWLQGTHMLILNEELSVQLGSIVLNYRRDTGLQWERKVDVQ